MRVTLPNRPDAQTSKLHDDAIASLQSEQVAMRLYHDTNYNDSARYVAPLYARLAASTVMLSG